MKVVFCLIVILTCLTGSTRAQDQETLLHQKIPSIELGSRNISEVLTFLAEKYDVPIANEISRRTTSDSAASDSKLVLKNASVEEILSTVFRKRPDYRWQIIDGVMCISSISEPEPLFDTIISEFSVKDQTISEIKKALAERPEVQFVLSETHAEFQELTILPGGNAEVPGKYTFTLHNATVRQILNRLILQTEGHYWTLVRLGNDKKLWIIVR